MMHRFNLLTNGRYLPLKGSFPIPLEGSVSNPFSTGELKCNSSLIGVIVAKEWCVDGAVP